MANFFLHVRDCKIDEQAAESFIVWQGSDDYATERAVDPILNEAARWAAVPHDLRTPLQGDQHASVRATTFLFVNRGQTLSLIQKTLDEAGVEFLNDEGPGVLKGQRQELVLALLP